MPKVAWVQTNKRNHRDIISERTISLQYMQHALTCGDR